MRRNIILNTDSYKPSHWKQYPKGTERVYSYFESRGGAFRDVTFFGLQYFLQEYLEGQVLTEANIGEANTVLAQHFGNSNVFNFDGWTRLLEKHDGYLPVIIRAVPEGTVVPYRNVMMTVENTDDEFPWLTNYLETLLSNVWYPCTVATQSREMKRMILESLQLTGDPSLINFKLHDFGQRGVSCPEQAALGGAAHLVNFMGSDTLSGIMMLRDHYAAPMAGFSIPATEHSTMTIYGREHEEDAVGNHLAAFPDGLLATVGDSFDIYNYCSNILGVKFRDQIINRKGTLVVRPDSGEPTVIVIEVLRLLAKAFGHTTNAKGYKVLPPYIRVIQGDGIDISMIAKLIAVMEEQGWSMDNLAFGSGGGLLQKVNRDTCKFAFKCSSAKVNGVWRDVFKDPITDQGKMSKRGRLHLLKAWDGTFMTVNEGQEGEDHSQDDLLETVFENGRLTKIQTLDDIRKRASL